MKSSSRKPYFEIRAITVEVKADRSTYRAAIDDVFRRFQGNARDAEMDVGENDFSPLYIRQRTCRFSAFLLAAANDPAIPSLCFIDES